MNAAFAPLWLTFGLLGLAIPAVWLAPIRLSPALHMPPWTILFGAAIASALAAGVVTPTGVGALALFAALAWAAAQEGLGRGARIGAGIATAIVGLALAAHKVPGFNNPQLIANVRFTPDAAPFTQYANFDKGAVGLILLALLCPRAGTGAEWRALLHRAWPIAAVLVALVMLVAVVAQVVRPAFKWPDHTPLFLITNLLLTCVAEEAYFRGFLQNRLASVRPASRSWQIAVVLLSAAMFGAAHLGGGVAYALLATLAGAGYAFAFASTGRIEAAILTHFALNAIHFVGFTYPAMASS
ncbi:MAG TPA: CPBP family intramembrane glutamic endopeptidase [Telluria sp.]